MNGYPDDQHPEETTLPALDDFVMRARLIVDEIDRLIADLRTLNLPEHRGPL